MRKITVETSKLYRHPVISSGKSETGRLEAFGELTWDDPW